MSERDEFERGLAAASLDEQPRRPGAGPGSAGVAAGVVVTVGDSWWHTRVCPGCGHTFRRGDRVVVDDDGRRVRHLEAGLGCADPGEAVGSAEDAREFSAGLLAAFPPPGDVTLVRAETVAGLVAPPFAGFSRSRCLFCSHTFRPGEWVIVCPCRQGRCQRAVHRDPARGLSCWESWRPDNQLAICPVLLTRVGT